MEARPPRNSRPETHRRIAGAQCAKKEILFKIRPTKLIAIVIALVLRPTITQQDVKDFAALGGNLLRINGNSR